MSPGEDHSSLSRGVVQVGSCHGRSSHGWVCSLVEHWLFGSSGWFPDVSTAHRLRWSSGKPSREAAGGSGTLLGPEETGTRPLFAGLVFVVFRPLRIRFAWLVGWVRACGPFRPPYHIGFSSQCFLLWGGQGVGGGVGWCPFVF
jgi:hypothetical protein